ncbi:hypothetical protein CK203_073632 [Vitis vinifera]|uniref:Uncharacterized protein n=1 Tax=Vitis vinifera TaxID=29760 RepID=A0A438DU11_VITVI|nr:hypothetical protein CK203_073632 [Vitis vinifera]
MSRYPMVTRHLNGQLDAKLLGLFEAVFEVTQKNQSSASGDDNHKDAGRFTFNESPIFVPATTLVLVHLVAMVKALAVQERKIWHTLIHHMQISSFSSSFVHLCERVSIA